MGVRERRERERDQTREKIMDAAREMFAREGYEAVSMRRIADAIEYSPTAIYVHFKDKRDLFRGVCREDFARLTQLAQKVGQIADPVERIRRIGYAYIEFALEHPNHYRLMFMTRHQNEPGDDLPGKGDPDVDGYTLLKQTVAQAIAKGRLRPDFRNVELATQTLWAAVHGMASLQIVKGNDPWIDWRPVKERAAAMVEGILHGVLADSASASQARRPSRPRKPRKEGPQ